VIWAARAACCGSTDPDGNRMQLAMSQKRDIWQSLVKLDCTNDFNDWE
jgi:hypothetical protein